MGAFYNRAEAIERLGGDDELFANVARLFIAESAAFCDALDHALAVADATTLWREAHTVKSMLATFSFESGRALAQQLEDLAASGDLDGAASLTLALVGAVKRLVEALTRDTV